MDLKKILDLLKKYQESDARLTVLFVEKKGTKYQSYKPEVQNSVQKDIIKLFKEQLEENISRDLQEVNFNPSGHEVDEYSVCDYEYVGNYQEVIKLFDHPLEEEMDPDEISYLIFRLRINEDTEP